MSLEFTPVSNEEERARSENLSRQPARPPAEVQGYEPQRFLGRGAFGEVWVAIDRNTGCRVAIKFFAQRGGLDWSLLAREVEKLRVLSNDPYVVQLLEVGWDSHPPYYVMAFQEQGSLDDRLRDGPLPVCQAVTLFREVAIGLSHAHNKGILHCDLKPANILLDQDDKPRLADFGQARLVEEHSAALGTMFYMAPEQADLDAVPDARWDVYALGAVLYCMLTGQPPYRDETVGTEIKRSGTLPERLKRYQQHLYGASRPAGHRQVPGVDRALAEIVDRCLAVSPERRFANAQAVISALDARALQKARRPLLVLGTVGPALLLVVMAVAAWFLVADSVRTATEQVTQRAQAGNQFAARFAANQVAAKMLHRWAILEREAADPRLHASLQNVRGKDRDQPERHQLQDYLDARWKKYDYAQLAASWFVVDPEGKLLAVSSPNFSPAAARQVIDQPFWHRDYYHGRGFDYDPDLKPRPPEAKPLDHPHLSITFRSSQPGHPFVVVFSVPVREKKPERQPLGILALSVQLGQFSELRLGDEQKWVTLVQTQEDVPSPRDRPGRIANAGLILDHPGLQQALAENQEVPAIHLPPEMVERLRSLRRSRQQGGNLNERDAQFDEYQDPVGASNSAFSGRWLAAAAPVIPPKGPIAGPEKLTGPARMDEGWVVLVQERYDTVVQPVEHLRWKLVGRGLLALGVVILVVLGLWGVVILGLNDFSRSTLARLVRRRAGLSTRSLSGGTSSINPRRSERAQGTVAASVPRTTTTRGPQPADQSRPPEATKDHG